MSLCLGMVCPAQLAGGWGLLEAGAGQGLDDADDDGDNDGEGYEGSNDDYDDSNDNFI